MNFLKAVFWDLDGTLADTEMTGHRVAFNEAFKSTGLNWYWDTDIYTQLLSITGGKARIRHYAKEKGLSLSNEDIVLVHNRKQEIYKNFIYSGKIMWRTGVKRLINELSENKISQWIVTTSSFDAVQALIKSTFSCDLGPFEGFVTAEDVENSKPSPECYLQAIELSGCKRTEIMVIEDSQVGYQSAINACLPCLITISPWQSFRIDSYPKAIQVLDHLGEYSKPCKVFKGLPCRKGLISFDFLQLLHRS